MRIKTKFLISVLENAMPAAGQKYTFSGGFEFVYPTAPNRVKLPDVKDEMNIVTEGDMYTNTEIYPKTESDMWAWGFGDYATEEIKLCDKSIRCLLRLMKTEGPFAGVIGFSTGATTGSILLSLAERGAADEITQQWGLDSSLLPSQPFKFGIFFSGCILSHPVYKTVFYPMLKTPVLHFIGELDTHLPLREMLKFSKRYKNSRTVSHPGSHFVPRYKFCQEEILSAGFALGDEGEAKIGKAWPSWSSKDSQVSIPSLRVMELIHFIKIGIQTELKPV
ncbi:hypothetical protein NA56DRAFT_727830 [Hyaloscypha hepaticicola]|uniref:Serine hydrolase domain-containing protein n=1 Tax=Hyaloscypha hepaticicola TaxID=2082293 RepID=A0A2J6PUV8_9HELO|nr:hypothetical protein NA56DRAFT_727830 [Hyaloscypha hepaticicola]